MTSRASHRPRIDPDPTRAAVTGGHSIVVGIGVDDDGTARSEAAASWAAREAERTGRRLVLMCGTGQHRGRLVAGLGRGRRAVRRLEAIASDLHAWHPRVPVAPVLRSGDAVDALVRASQQAEMVVVGKRTLGAVTRVLVRSISTAVAGHAAVPVVVVPDAWEQGARERDPVLIGVDAARRDDLALQFAFGRARQLAVPLIAVYAWGGEPSGELTTESGARGSAEAMTALEAVLESWRARHPDVDVRPMQRQGTPALVLLDVSAGAQAVVVGRHAPGVKPSFTFGSVAKAVLHYAECPVVVIPTPTDEPATIQDLGTSRS